MILASHQPDLLPYSGFWRKMHDATVFDLAIYDQVELPGYQQRVKMRGVWCSLPVPHSNRLKPITDVVIDPELWAMRLINTVRGRYRDAPNFRPVFSWFLDAVHQAMDDRLWRFNQSLILSMRDRLGIRTPVAIGSPPRGHGPVDGLLDVAHSQYHAKAYLSGPGGRAYLGEQELRWLRNAGVTVTFSVHRPVTEDSILSVLMDYDDPLKVVLA